MILYIFEDWLCGEKAVFSTEKKRKDFFYKWAHSLEEWPDEYEYSFLELELDKEFPLK